MTDLTLNTQQAGHAASYTCSVIPYAQLKDRRSIMRCDRKLPSGIVLRICASYFLSILSVMSEAIKPGAMALAVIDLLANSRANVLVRPSTPAYTVKLHQLDVERLSCYQYQSVAGKTGFLKQDSC